MKTFLLFTLALAAGITVSAQKFVKNQSVNIDRSAKLQKHHPVDEPKSNAAAYKPNYKPVSKSVKSSPGVVETMIGGTVYDAQTNVAVANRIYAYPDGTIGATWTMGYNSPNYADRGTGYNYFDGTSWSDEPFERIEPVRTGWPSYCPLGDGELVVAHDFVNGLQISKRPLKGTGDWTTTFLAAPAGATKVSWPRAVTVGNTIHIIACSGVAYQGLNLALIYYRSTDGGATWEAPIILPGLDAASLGAAAGKSFSGFGGDSYAWSAPKGDTIALAVAEPMGGIWILKSFDNGINWTKTTVFEMPVLSVAPSPIMPSTDGSIAIAMDSQGKVHLVFGRMNVSDDDYSAEGNSYYPYIDGLLYWNESMPPLDTTQLANYDTLQANGNLIAWMIDYNGNDTIDFPDVPATSPPSFPFGLYGVSVSSMGQIAIDLNDNISVIYSACREDLMNSGATPNIELYRHLYKISWLKNEAGWSEPVDLNDDIEHAYDECVFGSLAPYSDYYKLHIVYQIDPEPGNSIGSDEDEPSDNYINYLTFPTFASVQPADISKDVMISPNPASDFADVLVSLLDPQKVEIEVFDVMGKLLLKQNHGQQSTGYHTFRLNTTTFTSGMYLFTVKIGNSQTSRKVIVN